MSVVYSSSGSGAVIGVHLCMPVVAMHAGWVPEHATHLLGHLSQCIFSVVNTTTGGTASLL